MNSQSNNGIKSAGDQVHDSSSSQDNEEVIVPIQMVGFHFSYSFKAFCEYHFDPKKQISTSPISFCF